MVETSSPRDLHWVYINGLGEQNPDNVSPSDVLTAIKFDKSGEHLAVGDKGGRVIVFKYSELKNSRYFDYRYLTEVQSHEPEIDHLKSIDLEEKINTIEFLYHQHGSLKFLSSNDKVIKLWSLSYKVRKQASSCLGPEGQITMPELRVAFEGFESKERNQFRDCHNYNINSLSVSPCNEYFISADDLRVNLWNFEDSLLAFNIVDLKPPNIEELSEVITHAEFHPRISDLFIFSSSKGYISMCDLRMNSTYEKCATFYQVEEDPSKKHFFSDIINSVSRAKFNAGDDNVVYSRDYLKVNAWDLRNTKSPTKSLLVTDYLDKKLCDVYESESIFDKFDL